MISNTFCALPFVHSCTRVDGSSTPCCRFEDSNFIEKTSPKAYFYSDKLAAVRTQMLEGKQLTGCRKCYQEEELGRKSMRQIANEDYLQYDIPKNTPIKFIEISFDNLCNMACVPCATMDSSKWNEYVDIINYDNAFGGRLAECKNIDTILDFSPVDYQSTIKVNLLGGEPFLNVKNIDFLEKFNLQNIIFTTNTNCSIIPNKRWQNILKKIQSLNIKLSIDGINDIGAFSRYGVPWKQIEKTMDWFIDFKKTRNFTLSVHSMCHIFNVFDINNFEKYLQQRNLRYKIDCVHGPAWLDIKILPKKVKEQLIDHVKYDYVKQYLIKNIDFVDEYNLDKFFLYANRLQKRQHFVFVDNIVEEIMKWNGKA